MPSDAIELLITGKAKDIGGFEVRRLLPVAKRRAVGSFVFLDHMGPTVMPAGHGLDVRPHPHIGLATVTYLYEGSILHRDSLGSVQEIFPGDVNWMTAGRGIVHSERSADNVRAVDQSLNGLQMWVALPLENEEVMPEFSHVPKSSLPVLSGNGWQGRLIAGSLFGETSSVVTKSRLFFADLELNANTEMKLEPDYDECAVYVSKGGISIDGQGVSEGELAVLKNNTHVELMAEAPAVIAVFGGDTLPEPRHIFWNFVSSSKDRIEQAKEDWRQMRFEKVPGDDEFTPLPDEGR